ncbi:antibiotic biosynthesis monooxygenase family protein [Haloarchaeobius amylolyticus]|uniref:antibiotic biosynthesis monooxygenase family protein n=1 Tax=Haloarchaeobius amylolyticus TaxID=1198296 RepID=UPI00226FDEB7|nr:antibiotic biosynthesis monooxygenase [Haloarchaeobius amylolyticus]
MFVVANRIPVAEGHEDAFEARFEARAEKVDQREGFVRMEVLRPVEADRYVVLTYWESEDAFDAWTESEEFREAHRDRPPKEMFSGKSEMESHEVFISAEK